MTEQEYWDQATTSQDLRNEWICDKDVTDNQCKKLIFPYLNKGKTLDLGCGIGRLTKGYGVDISPLMLKLAIPGNEYKLCDGRTIPYPDELFDNVFSVFMFQHIPDEAKKQYIKEVWRVLKPKGIFRLQYVEGDEIAPFSYQTRDLQLEGFKVLSKENRIYPEWVWVTGVKV